MHDAPLVPYASHLNITAAITRTRDGDDVNAPALVIGHVGSFAFRVGPNRRFDASLPLSLIGEPE